jgi:hypothetical protein
MKMKGNVREILKILTLSTVIIGAAMACTKSNYNNQTPAANSYTISGSANGANMVPSVSGNGIGSINGTYDPNTHTLNYTTNWSGLSGKPTSGGFYNAAAGSNGPAIGTPWTFDSTSIANGKLTGQMNLTQDQAQQLTNGNWYYTIGTPTNTSGEIRGQLTAKQQP